MSKAVLAAAIVASLLAVGTIAAVTVTVIVDDNGRDAGVVRFAPQGPTMPPMLPRHRMGPGFRGGGFDLPRLFECLQRHGGSTVTPDLKTMRACGRQLPGMPALPH